MNINSYLNLIYKLVESNQLKEKREITTSFKNKTITKNHKYKKSIKTKLYTCTINLENNKVLLIEDIGINFLIAYSIIIGRHTKLIEFNIEEDDKIQYIAQSDLLEILKQKFKIKNTKEIRARELFNMKYTLNFNEIERIKQLKRYISKRKNIDFEKIHITQSKGIENFIPTVKQSHFKLAKSMNIPLVSLIDNNYIKGSTINIYDEKKIEETLKPLFIREKNITWYVESTNNTRLYNDIYEGLYIDINKEKIIDIITQCQYTNFNRENIIEQILKLKDMKISSKNGEILIPLWKSKERQEFVTIKDEQDFKEISGVKFRLEKKFLQSVYISTTQGEQANFNTKFLTKDFEKLIDNLKETPNIKYSNIQELIIKLIYNSKTDIESIEIVEKNSINHTQEIINTINKILDIIILKSINQNKTPKKLEENNSFNNEIFLSLYTSTKISIDEYKKQHLKNKTLKNVIKTSNVILDFIKTQKEKIKSEDLYYALQTILIQIDFFKEIKVEEINQIERKYNDYFKDIKKETIAITNKNLEEIANHINIINRILKDKQVYIVKKKELDKDLFVNNINTINKHPTDIIIKPNMKKLSKVFKYSYKDIANQIKQLTIENINSTVLTFKEKQIKIIKDYYIIFEKYRGYKTILTNDYFITLVEE